MDSPDFKNQQRQVNAKTEPKSTIPPVGNLPFNLILNQAQQWFEALPPLGKLFIILLGAFVGLSLLNTVLKLLTSLVVVGVLAIAVYAGYQFIKATDGPGSPPDQLS